ncbi:MAG: hypothetical protein CXT78_05385 [Thaumarchaeota archaeon]|jgi:predicted dehydrogenase|nr:MAG: hypothetical protein CXT78_05385 [Nitrososphaerota archaeon]
MINQPSEKLANIDSNNFQNKSVLIIGSGYIALEYVKALKKLKIKNIEILSKSKNSLDNKVLSEYKIIFGGFEKKINLIEKKDLTIIATPINLLVKAATLAIKSGQENILIEKPGSLFKTDLIILEKLIKKQKVRIAYNRLFYPNFQKLKILSKIDGGITSCKFDFTEWVHTIPFGKYKKDVYRRWGISNSLHVISMAMELIGMPKKITTSQHGNLKWHHTGSIFVGNGISEKNIPFSYHANWEGGGRWGIEVVTKKNVYRLSPLEKLFVLKKGTTEWKEIQIKNIFPKIKMGLVEEIVIMLDDALEKQLKMVTIKRAIEYNKLAEKIFAYKN